VMKDGRVRSDVRRPARRAELLPEHAEGPLAGGDAA
jgi:hypothetical protein